MFQQRNMAAGYETCRPSLRSFAEAPLSAPLFATLATDPKKRELFARLAEHLDVLASAVEQVIAGSGGTDIAMTHQKQPCGIVTTRCPDGLAP